MSNVKKVAITIICMITYVLLNASVGHPLFGGIHVDFGYIPIMILAVMASEIGIYPAVICGTVGYTAYAVFLSKEGFSCGQFAAVLIVSTAVAWCCYKTYSNAWAITQLVGVAVIFSEIVNTAIECWIFPLPIRDELIDNLSSGCFEILILSAAYGAGVVLWAVISGESLD